MVGCAIRNGAASSVTEQTPRRSRSSMARRVGSARAPKMALSRSGAAGRRRLAYIAMLLYTRPGRFYQGATELPLVIWQTRASSDVNLPYPPANGVDQPG